MKNTDFKIIVFMDVTSCPRATFWRDFQPAFYPEDSSSMKINPCTGLDEP
jgi:hypothetical protein